MKRLIGLLLLTVACGATSAQKAIESPIAKEPWHPKEAPPASTSDEDRHGLTQTFDDMSTTQNAYDEARQPAAEAAGSAAPTAKPAPYPPRFPNKTPPPKKGPAEEAPKE
jgi:hypothetical protein